MHFFSKRQVILIIFDKMTSDGSFRNDEISQARITLKEILGFVIGDFDINLSYINTDQLTTQTKMIEI
jgi:hypothetical protein